MAPCGVIQLDVTHTQTFNAVGNEIIERTDEKKTKQRKEEKISFLPKEKEMNNKKNRMKRERMPMMTREGIPNEIRFRLFNVNCLTLYTVPFHHQQQRFGFSNSFL
jgi:hypothetical protein